MILEAIFGLIGIACILYGAFVAMAHTGSFFFVVWEAVGVILLAFVGLLHFDLIQKIARPIRIGALALAGVCILLLAITLPLVVSGFSGNMEREADYIIVLGAQVRNSGPSVVLRYRLDTAADYLQRHPDTVCICGGGQGWNESEPEGTAMKEYLVKKGIAEDRIITETRSSNTTENMKFSQELINGTDPSVGIVTNDFHAKRAGYRARGAGINNSFTIAAPSSRPDLANNVFRECIAMVKDFVFGNF